MFTKIVKYQGQYIKIPLCFYNKQKKEQKYIEPRPDNNEWNEKRIKRLMERYEIYDEKYNGFAITTPSGKIVVVSPHILRRAWNRLGPLDNLYRYGENFEIDFTASYGKIHMLKSLMSYDLSIGIQSFIIKLIENGSYYHRLCSIYDTIYGHNTYCFVIDNIPVLMKIDRNDKNALILVNTYAPNDPVAKNKWVSYSKRNRNVKIKT